MQKWQSKNLSQRLWEEGWTMSSPKTITSQKSHSNERCTSEGGGRDKLKKVDGDFPTCMRKIETIMEMKQERRKTWKEKEEDDSSIAPSMEMYRCVWGKHRRKAIVTAAAKERSARKMKAMLHTEQNEAQRHEQNGERKQIYVHKFYWKKRWRYQKQKVTFIILQKNMRSMHSSEKNRRTGKPARRVTDGMQFYWVKRGDMNQLSYGRHITTTFFMGAGKYENKHGVGIMLNKSGEKELLTLITSTNQRTCHTTTILVNRQHIKLMSVYFSNSKYADHHIKKMYKTIEKTHGAL